VPKSETIAGIAVKHPRTLFVPKLALATWGPLYAASIAPLLAKYRGSVDVVLGAWAYPDGFAAVLAARMLGVPSVIKLHGSDINIVAKQPGPRWLTAWALPRATRVVAVSRPLADEVIALGVPADRVEIVMNGVDRALFTPRDRAAARAELGLPAGPLAVYIGNLKPEKGVLDLVRAWHSVPEGMLLIVGDGPLRDEMTRALDERVRLIPRQPLERVPRYLAAADVVVLASHSEGTPNVILEALACGRRVVATNVGGIPDLIDDDELGTLVPPHDSQALAAAISAALRRPYDQQAIAKRGARGGWAASAAALHAVLEDAAKVHQRGLVRDGSIDT
jgi:glycosyltransferase involved in cell wall biosynthesis